MSENEKRFAKVGKGGGEAGNISSTAEEAFSELTANRLSYWPLAMNLGGNYNLKHLLQGENNKQKR